MTEIRKLLVANRGEIAVRIMRTAKARGIATVAVYSDADAGAYHTRFADEAYYICGPEAAASYLQIAAILEVAARAGADAIHPGYGFLSERAAFAEACAANGIIFVGPPAAAISAMGDKAESKRRMIAAGVPCVPGYQGEDQTDSRLSAEAVRIGFPVLLKASAGGGGRGQRVVERASDIKDAIASARRESKNAFGDDRLIVERAIAGARHVEIQIIADAHGACIHLGERDCSLQRRRQKVIEESPSPAITPEIRKRMGEAAIAAARAVDYCNAGTVEFLFDSKSSDFYFLEMNTRLQVEHPVTELVTGLDIVGLQLDIAAGRKLALTQQDVRLEGAAIEARLYAEDPGAGFLPQTGEIAVWRPSSHARIDAGIEEGDCISSFYDPMIAKIIAHGATRDEARMKLAAALRETILLGLGNNRDFLVTLLEDKAFSGGEAATDYIEKNLSALTKTPDDANAAILALAAAVLVDRPFGDLLTGWNSRGGASFPLSLSAANGAQVDAMAIVSADGIEIVRQGKKTRIRILSKNDVSIRYVTDGRTGEAFFARQDRMIDIAVDGRSFRYVDLSLAPAEESGAGADNVIAPMAGAVTSVLVKPGDVVAKGQTLATIDAMKMEHQLKAPRDGVVAEVTAKAGDQVAIRTRIIALEPEK